MRRQRNLDSTTMKRPKLEGATLKATTAMSATKKKDKREVEKVKGEVVKVEEERSEGRELGLAVALSENVIVLEVWCPWLGGAVDEHMSWGSIWLPCWDVEFMCEAYSVFFGDVVWDDDIWNLMCIKEVAKP